jgi:hypothetical protein
MPKPRSKISALPSAVRTAINLKLQEGWRLVSIAEWLMPQTAPVDIPDLQLKAGEPYSLLWSRDADQSITPQRLCERALSRWYTTAYPRWLHDQAEREEFLGLVERAEQLGAAVPGPDQSNPSDGTNRLIRSLLFEAITKVRKNENNSADIARLTHAWARLHHASNESEQLKLRTQNVIDAGLQAMYDECKGNPKAIAAFYTFHDLVKGTVTDAGAPPSRPANN